MSDMQAMLKGHRLAVRLVILLSGFLLIVVSLFAFPSSDLSIAILSIGVTLVSSTVIAFFGALFGSDEETRLRQVEEHISNKISTLERLLAQTEVHIDHGISALGDVMENRRIYNMGLVGIGPRYGGYEKLPDVGTAHQIDMLHNAGRYDLQKYKFDIIDAIMKCHCTVRILLSDPDGEVWANEGIHQTLAAHTPPEFPIRELIRKAMGDIESIIRELNQHRSTDITFVGSMEVRLFQGFSTSNLFIVNSAFVRHTPRLTNLRTEESPVYDIVKGHGDDLLLEIYVERFNSIWDASEGRIQPNLCFRVREK